MFESIMIVSLVLFAALLLMVILIIITRRQGKTTPTDSMMSLDKKHTFLTSGKSESGTQKMVVLDEKELFDQPPGF